VVVSSFGGSDSPLEVRLGGILACFGVSGYPTRGLAEPREKGGLFRVRIDSQSVAEPGEKGCLLGVCIDTLSVAEPGEKGGLP
jgi:hypothetical protein